MNHLKVPQLSKVPSLIKSVTSEWSTIDHVAYRQILDKLSESLSGITLSIEIKRMTKPGQVGHVMIKLLKDAFIDLSIAERCQKQYNRIDKSMLKLMRIGLALDDSSETIKLLRDNNIVKLGE